MKADSNLMLTNRKAYCMKRFVIGASLAVMSFVSCMEEVAAPVAVSRDLYAQIEQEEITRTVMDADNNIRWSEGDQVVAFMKSSLGVKYQIKDEYVGKTSGYFSMVSSGSSTDIGGGMELDHNIVFYPYPIAAECEKSGLNYHLNVVLPVEQSYAPESFGNGSFPMVAVSGNTNLTFRNVLGGMKLQLKGTGKVSSIRVEGKNEERLSGEATVTAYTDEETGPSITMASSASTSVSLNCGGIQLDEDTATEFIIALPPVTLADGFTVTVTDADGNEQSIESDKSNEIRRSALLVMPEITLNPEEPESQEGDYIDEYGINHGPGTDINGVVWAPVNCGYHKDDFKYGKLYQWGRKYGQGYDGSLYDSDMNNIGEYSDNLIPEIVFELVSVDAGQEIDNADIFYATYGNSDGWSVLSDDHLWHPCIEDNPTNPCPYGWRVPTDEELNELSQNYSEVTTDGTEQSGRWFSGTESYEKNVPQIFLPAAGERRGYGGDATSRGIYGEYWSAIPSGSRARSLHFGPQTVNMTDRGQNTGMSVRCVKGVSKASLVSRVMISPETLKLYESDYYYLNVYISPELVLDKSVVWSSADPSIAVVEQSGRVTAVSPGTVIVSATCNGVTGTCEVTVVPIAEPTVDYIDEYGVNRGKGVGIGMAVWAPVNCGFHETDYKYGKLYQWGRKYGQGYSGELEDMDGNQVGETSDATTPIIEKGGVVLDYGNSKENAGVFYTGSDWLAVSDDSLWNSGTDDAPVKTQYDPCPDGWRVPTYAELKELKKNRSSKTINEDGQMGYWFSGPLLYASSSPQVFLPAAGERSTGGYCSNRGYSGKYWTLEAYSYGAFFLTFYYNIIDVSYYNRSNGYSVRCVQE